MVQPLFSYVSSSTSLIHPFIHSLLIVLGWSCGAHFRLLASLLALLLAPRLRLLRTSCAHDCLCHFLHHRDRLLGCASHPSLPHLIHLLFHSSHKRASSTARSRRPTSRHRCPWCSTLQTFSSPLQSLDFVNIPASPSRSPPPSPTSRLYRSLLQAET